MEAEGQFRDGFDASRLALFIVATLEGGMLLTRVKRNATVMAGIGEDLKGFIVMQLIHRHAALGSAADVVSERAHSAP